MLYIVSLGNICKNEIIVNDCLLFSIALLLTLFIEAKQNFCLNNDNTLLYPPLMGGALSDDFI